MKTLDKLKELCDPHGVTIDAYRDDWGDWDITFDAPPKMCFGSSTATVVVYRNDTLRGVISYIKSELASGFYLADYQTLAETGQLSEQGELK